MRFTYRSSRDSVKPMKRVAERGNKFWKDYVTSPQGYLRTPLNERINLNENQIEHSKC